MSDFWQKAEYGLQDSLLRSLANQLMGQAMNGFERLPSCFQAPESVKTLLKFFEYYTFFHKTPADELVEAVNKTTNKVPTYDVFLKLEEMHKNFILK